MKEKRREANRELCFNEPAPNVLIFGLESLRLRKGKAFPTPLPPLSSRASPMGLGRDISSFRFKVPSLDELQTFPIPIARTQPKAPTADKRTVTREPFLALRTELSGIFFLFKRISFAPTSSCWVE